MGTAGMLKGPMRSFLPGGRSSLGRSTSIPGKASARARADSQRKDGKVVLHSGEKGFLAASHI